MQIFYYPKIDFPCLSVMSVFVLNPNLFQCLIDFDNLFNNETVNGTKKLMSFDLIFNKSFILAEMCTAVL